MVWAVEEARRVGAAPVFGAQQQLYRVRGRPEYAGCQAHGDMPRSRLLYARYLSLNKRLRHLSPIKYLGSRTRVTAVGRCRRCLFHFFCPNATAPTGTEGAALGAPFVLPGAAASHFTLSTPTRTTPHTTQLLLGWQRGWMACCCRGLNSCTRYYLRS